jgi:ubiquitin-protein ligase
MVYDNVSAAPLDENVFEWHCNFKHDEIIYHLLLLFTDKYPYEGPSAEFVPVGFQYNSGATKPGSYNYVHSQNMKTL